MANKPHKRKHPANEQGVLSLSISPVILIRDKLKDSYQSTNLSILIAFISRLKPNVYYIVNRANQLTLLGHSGLVQLEFLLSIMNKYTFMCQGLFYETIKKIKSIKKGRGFNAEKNIRIIRNN